LDRNPTTDYSSRLTEDSIGKRKNIANHKLERTETTLAKN